MFVCRASKTPGTTLSELGETLYKLGVVTLLKRKV
jgi:hypothetical protein